MIYFAFLQTLILLVSIFKPVFNLLYILKTNMVNNPQRVMASVNVVRYFDLKGLKFWKKLRVKYARVVGSRFEALGVLGSKSWRKQTHIFFWKKWGSVFFMFLIRALLRPQITIWRRANISHVIFSWFWPLKIKISGKKLYGHNPHGILNHIGF